MYACTAVISEFAERRATNSRLGRRFKKPQEEISDYSIGD